MESLKKKKLMVYTIVATAFLLVGTIAYAILRDDDPYKYFTGIGDQFEISPDDKHFLFPYYVDGKEGLYKANVDGTDVRQITSSDKARHHSPKYSGDGAKILFLSKNSDGVNSLYVANQDGSQQKQITFNDVHVSEAVFSYTGETLYYTGVSASALNKAEGETKDGFDLYSVNLHGENTKQLTTKDYFSMKSLSVSPDGKAIYYSLFDGDKERFTSFSLENNEEKEASISEVLPKDSYNHQLSPNENKLAYTAVSEESQNTSLYKYELFTIDIDERQPKRLTHLNSSVVSPKFFHRKNQMAFLEHTNWSGDPAENDLYVLDIGTGDLQPVELALSPQVPGHWFIKGINKLVNGLTIAVLYMVLIGLLITYLHQYNSKRKSYVPAIASLILTVLVFISTIMVVIMVDPWLGMGLGTIAIALLGCTVIVFGYAFVLNSVVKRN
ncbi:DPP IV N-terminal domain-containing protein [Lysinibacillus sp. NPDC097287]|uniref:DPP IV N-terminal domain-containing protein n=1 Tax=Lysinibacillus sp. NPDC097287 TaxID=3364144 RepID=UPI00381DF959